MQGRIEGTIAEVTEDLERRMKAQSKGVCLDCYYGAHDHCDGKRWAPRENGVEAVDCECECEGRAGR